MAEPELLLDSSIRIWVVLPIVFITFVFGIIRHYLSLLMSSDKVVSIDQIRDSQVILRCRYLRENGHYLPPSAFNTRKHYLINDEDGLITKGKEKQGQAKNPMTDPSMMTDMLKGNVLNVLPMIVIGGWIQWTFSGFVTTKVPFPLTIRFKPMLQRGIELEALDASWVSSASWYFLNVFGLRSMYSLILGEDNAADQTRIMQEQMSGAALNMQQDPQKVFKAEWESLQVTQHRKMLEFAPERCCSTHIFPDEIYTAEMPHHKSIDG
ncbi:ER membrane protein complex subunit 3-like [Styela clava]|uniref:ER membrane protein complex subunit 3-like n=1 Tax=Styela clava TaxID=7725 RepID=UPI00193A6CB8|nr:ER membrane protein complex subunit 3-like [Styela clava]